MSSMLSCVKWQMLYLCLCLCSIPVWGNLEQVTFSAPTGAGAVHMTIIATQALQILVSSTAMMRMRMRVIMRVRVAGEIVRAVRVAATVAHLDRINHFTSYGLIGYSSYFSCCSCYSCCYLLSFPFGCLGWTEFWPTLCLSTWLRLVAAVVLECGAFFFTVAPCNKQLVWSMHVFCVFGWPTFVPRPKYHTIHDFTSVVWLFDCLCLYFLLCYYCRNHVNWFWGQLRLVVYLPGTTPLEFYD